MKYLYYYLWVGLASLHPIVSKSFMPVILLRFKILKKSKEEQVEWRKNYNKLNLEFPGGINDWYVFSLFVGIIIGIVLCILTYFNAPTLNKYSFALLFISITVVSYYWIYVKHINWLKKRIGRVIKKYYF